MSTSQVGQIPDFMRRKLLLWRSRFHYGEAFDVGLWPGRRTLMLTCPDDIKHVLGVRASNYIKSRHLTSDESRESIGKGLISSQGPEHHEKRRLLWPTFKPRAILDSFFGLVRSKVEELVGRWQPGQEIELAAQTAQLSQSIIIAAIFGRDFEDAGCRLRHAISARRSYHEWFYSSRIARRLLPNQGLKDFEKAQATIDACLYGQIRQRRQLETPTDLIGLLLRATRPDGSQLSDRELRDELMPLTTTGYETTGESMAWAVYLLAEHPEVEKRLLEELDSSNADDQQAALPYTKCVIAEVLRLFPPTWAFVRVPLADDHLPSGADIRPIDTLMLCPYLMHRHPGLFEQPHTFSPQRFVAGKARTNWQYAYFPFGEGAHKCIGQHLAELELRVFLTTVLPRFRFKLVRPDRIKPRAGLTLAPHPGVRAVLQER